MICINQNQELLRMLFKFVQHFSLRAIFTWHIPSAKFYRCYEKIWASFLIVKQRKPIYCQFYIKFFYIKNFWRKKYLVFYITNAEIRSKEMNFFCPKRCAMFWSVCKNNGPVLDNDLLTHPPPQKELMVRFFYFLSIRFRRF